MSDIGFKRVCMFCSTKFYDFNQTPIVCPKCGETFDQNALFKRKIRAKEDEDELTMDSLGLGDSIELDKVEEDVLLDVDDNDSDEVDNISREDVGSNE